MKKGILILALLVGQNAFAREQRSFVQKSFTPATSLNVAYADEDQIGGVSTLTGVPASAGGYATLWGVVVTDEDKQNAALDLLFFNASPTIASADNAQISMADSEAAKLVGKVSLVAGDCTSNFASTSVCSKNGINAPIKVASGQSLYVMVQSQGTPTYTAASSLKFKLFFGQE